MHTPRPSHSVGWTCVALVMLLILAWVDSRTGPDFRFSLLYLLPVVLTAVTQGRSATVGAAITATVGSLAAEMVWQPHPDVAVWVWNGLTHLVIFLALGLMTVHARRHREQLAAMNVELNELLHREGLLARTDPLTGLSNLRYFLERVGFEAERARRYQHALAVAYVDLDNFKQLNDTRGHAAGDEMLRKVADALRSHVRAVDIPARLGGDEFAVLFTEAEPVTLEAVANRLVTEIEALGRSMGGADLGASIGMAFFRRPPADPAELLRHADEAMYQAKALGKGRVVVTHPLLPGEAPHAVERRAGSGQEGHLSK
ncbi:MAG: GGDEF domain-containing protein [Myxococcota bacterium]